MQLIIFYFVMMITLSTCQDKNCKWTYRCCKFKEVNGETTCEEMCEALINCDITTTQSYDSNEIETFNQISTDEKSEKFFYAFRKRRPVPACENGFKYTNGQCRRILKLPNTNSVDNDKK